MNYNVDVEGLDCVESFEDLENVEEFEEKLNDENVEEIEKVARELNENDIEDELELVINKNVLKSENELLKIFNKYKNNVSYDSLCRICDYIISVAHDVDDKECRDYAPFVESVLQNELSYLKRKEMVKNNVFNPVVDITSQAKREEVRAAMAELHRKERLSSIRDIMGAEVYDKIVDEFDFDRSGMLRSKCITNYDLIVRHDPTIHNVIKRNMFDNRLYYNGQRFGNSHLLRIVSYIDRVYSIGDSNLIMNALDNPDNVECYDPVKDLIEEKEWDGVERIDNFFENICNVGAKNNIDRKIYYREVARMLFYGGINRLYHPGCKFDYMPILVGDQGTCKSTLVRELALYGLYFNELRTIENPVAAETIRDLWICELAELMAFTRAKDVQSIKMFISQQSDKYRQPYARLTEDCPRHCIFVGTTNDTQFLNDPTGNRRFLPVTVYTDAEWFFENLDSYIRPYILECWREALYRMKHGQTYLTLSPSMYKIVEEVRAQYTDDDPAEGLVLDYLDKVPVGGDVCGLEIYTQCYNGLRNRFGRTEARNIATIIARRKDFVRASDRKRFEKWGLQRYWYKIDNDEQV